MHIRKLFDILPFQLDRYPQTQSLVGKLGNEWISYSTSKSIEWLNQISAGLLNMGVQKGENIAIFSRFGSPEWTALDFGIQQIGGVVVPIHASNNAEELQYILEDANIRFCFVDGEILIQKILPILESSPVQKIFSLQDNTVIPSFKTIYQNIKIDYSETIENIKSQITDDEVATIIYTSGTTGKPKGVMLSHKNLVSNIQSIIPLVPIHFEHRAISFLPMSHIFERMVTYAYMVMGVSVYFVHHLEDISNDLKTIQPHYFTCVPRFLEKVYEQILQESTQRGKVAQKLLSWAINIGEQYRGKNKGSFVYKTQLRIADLLIFRLWRKALGGQVEGIVVGAAATNVQLGQLFSAAGIRIREGYGLTETSPVVAFNRFEPGGMRFGTVGMPVPGVEIKIHEPNESGEGEIWVKGANVMKGYYKLPEQTAAVINLEGWFKTGDVGKIVYKKFLQITDRKKDIFKTSYGKYIAPSELESKLKSSNLIEQCMIIGFRRPYVVALIVPNMWYLKQWCLENNVHWTAPQFMVINQKVEAHFETIIEGINQQLANHKKIKNYHLLHEEWTAENGLLTHTLKTKRAVVEQQYVKEINKLYS